MRNFLSSLGEERIEIREENENYAFGREETYFSSFSGTCSDFLSSFYRMFVQSCSKPVYLAGSLFICQLVCLFVYQFSSFLFFFTGLNVSWFIHLLSVSIFLYLSLSPSPSLSLSLSLSLFISVIHNCYSYHVLMPTFSSYG